MNPNNINDTQSNSDPSSSLWDYMTKQQDEKAKCNKCNAILSRKNGATSGLRKHLFQVHKLDSFKIDNSQSSRSKLYQISPEEKKKIDSLLINCIVQDGRSFDDMRRPGMLKVFKYLAPGIAHRLHLVVCNGLGIWIRKKPVVLSANAPTTSNIDVTSNSDPNDIDSDEEDYIDEIQLNSRATSLDDSPDSVESFDESLDTLNNISNMKADFNTIGNVNYVDDDQDNLSIDITDNWSIDVIEELDNTTGEVIQEDIGVLMKKCRSMVKFINKSSILMNYVATMKLQLNINVSLQLDCKHRWSSTQYLVEVMLTYKRIINRINSEKYDIGLSKKQTNKISSIELDQFDWRMLEMLDIVLKPFVWATNIISGSQYPTIGMAYFAIVQIRDFLDDSTNNNLSVSNVAMFIRLKRLLLNQIEKYFLENDEQWQIMKVHAYFDPIGYGCLTRRERRAVEVDILNAQDPHESQETDEDEADQTESPSNKTAKTKQSSSMAKFLTSIGKKKLSFSSNEVSTTKNKLNDEIITYRSLAQKEYNSIVEDDKQPDVMQFWEKHQPQLNYLSKIAFDHLVTPATSVACESAFSTASYLLRKQRSRLTPTNLSYSMFLKDKLGDESDDIDISKV